uniref:OSJNBb0026I12.2 protein n=1 Tax=Oryza sativa subsp. japonica TaxID=39947 RepID=Q7XNX8_ORYSJ|nr:OSJNBb0026I12.2 [Oryza sativa Japonica Group]
MATTDATIAHIMDEQEDIKIKSSKCWNPIRPPTTLLTSNGCRICIRPPFSAREYLMESSWSPLSNGSSLIVKFHLIEPQLKQQGIRLICTGKINNPRRCVSIAKAQHNVSYHNSPKDRANNSLECRKELRVHQVVSELSLLAYPELHIFDYSRTASVCQGIDTSNLHWGAWLSRWIRKIIGDSCAQHRHLRRDMRRDQHDHYEEVHNHEKEERDMKEPPVPLITLKVEAPPLSEEGIKGKLNGAEQPLVEPTAGIPLSQVDLLAVLCDKEELCDNASLISMPQLVNEHAISSVSLCADFKHVVHIANEVQERELLSSLNTLGYVQFDDFCELDNLKKKLFAKSDLPCPTTAIFHIFGESDDRGIYLVHRVYICSDLEPPIHVDKTCKLERNVIANQIVSSLPCFDWKKQVVVNGLRKEHHMEKPRTVFREEGEDDVTMATTDATIAHIMDEQEDIKIKSSKCWNPIRPPTTLLTSNGCRICIRPPFSAREYLMESSWSPLSNGSSLIAKFHLIEPQLKQQGAASPIMGLWACNFVWDPGPGIDSMKTMGTMNYFIKRKPPAPLPPPDPIEYQYLKETVQELTSIMSDEWLKEAELSSEVIRINTAPRTIPCRLEGSNVGIFYSPTVGANIVLESFAFAYLSDKTITPTDKFFKHPNGNIIEGFGVVQDVPVIHDGMEAILDFHVFEVPDIDVLI